MTKNVNKFDFESAFKALDEIATPKVKGVRANRLDLSESCKRVDRLSMLVEEYYNVNDSNDLVRAKDDREDDVARAKLDRIERIVDLDAETAEDILPSYVGKNIIQCPNCLNLFYKDPADIEVSEDNDKLVNVGEICQHCGNDSGYTLIGKVAADEPEEEVPEQEETANEENTSENETEENQTEEELPELESVPEAENEEENKEESDNVEEAEPEEIKESVNNSEFQKEAENDPEPNLKTENESEHKTLNESEVEDAIDEFINSLDTGVEESLNNSELLKTAETDPEINLKTENESENKTINEACENCQNAEKLEECGEVQETLDINIDATGNSILSGNQSQVDLGDLGSLAGTLGTALAEDAESKLVFSEDEVEKMLNSEEFETPISEAETETYLAENANEDEFEDFDENTFDENVTKYLTEVYSNVESYSTSYVYPNDMKLVVEGVISFKSGKTKSTMFEFMTKDNTLVGTNKDLCEGCGFTVSFKNENRTLITESLSYNYKINDNVVKGEIQ